MIRWNTPRRGDNIKSVNKGFTERYIMAKNFYRNLYIATRFATGFAEGALSTLAARFVGQKSLEKGLDNVSAVCLAGGTGIVTFVVSDALTTKVTNAILLKKVQNEIAENIQEAANAVIGAMDEMTAPFDEEAAEAHRRFQEEVEENFQRFTQESNARHAEFAQRCEANFQNFTEKANA